MSRVQIRRHAAKAISYRLLGTCQTALIGYIITGSWQVASSMGIIEICVKPIMYFVHERLWYKYVTFGLLFTESTNVGTSKQ